MYPVIRTFIITTFVVIVVEVVMFLCNAIYLNVGIVPFVKATDTGNIWQKDVYENEYNSIK